MKNLTKAMQDVWGRDPVLGALLIGLKIEHDPQIGTMATDGQRLKICDEWADKLTRNQAAIVLAHEALHVARAHHLRRGRADRDVWNQAADAAINHELRGWPGADWIEEGGTTAANQGLPEGRGAEEYVQILIGRKPPEPEPGDQPEDKPGEGDQDEEGRGDGDGDQNEGADSPEKGSGTAQDASESAGGDNTPPEGSGGSTGDPSEEPEEAKGMKDGKPLMGGDVEDSPEPDPTLAEQEYEQRMLMAIETAETCGNLPGWAAEMKAQLTAKPKLNWRVLLRQWLVQRAKIRRTFERPSRRQAVLGGELLRPGKGGRKIGKLAFLVDVSGSMNAHAEKLELAVAEIKRLAEVMPDTEVRVIQWSSDVVSEQDLRQLKEWKWRVGGGTLVQPAFKAAMAWRADMVVVWTDGCLFDLPERVLVPALWCVVTDATMPKRVGSTINV